ncbi:MAG: hypothetical protein WC943_06870 [Elusimicrobiota bacterium]|jgi:rubrerythrin
MDIAKTLKTALAFERKVAETYAIAAAGASDPKGKKFLETLAAEERRHIEYLESRAAEFGRLGAVTVPALETAVPDGGRVRRGAARLRKTMRKHASTPGREEVALLTRVVRAEEEVTAFYRAAVAEAGGDARKLFSRFLEIEEGHTAPAQAEPDSVTGMGFWLDVREFDLESA